MFGKSTVGNMISRSAENASDRRAFLTAAGVAGLGVVGTSMLAGSGIAAAAAAAPSATAAEISDSAVLNFALNLEYLEGEFYSYAVTGHGIAERFTDGKGTKGGTKGGRKVNFKDKGVKQYAEEINGDEFHHVAFLRSALGSSAVSRPALDIQGSFTAAARAAGVVGLNETFDPYKDDDSFLLGAFLFEDVGVSAYKGAAPLINNKTYLEAAAGILAVEAYHAAIIRLSMLDRGLAPTVAKLSALRDKVDGKVDDDQGITGRGKSNLVPTDSNALAYSRSTGQVLNIVYGTPKKVTKGGFFPAGMNGSINTSAASG